MLNRTCVGQPVIIFPRYCEDDKAAVGRISRLSAELLTSNERLSQIVFFSTPAGVETEIGIPYLEDASNEDIKKLKRLEENYMENHSRRGMYKGFLTNKQMGKPKRKRKVL